jgi:hypothetical protein
MVEVDVVFLAIALEEEENYLKTQKRKRKVWVDYLWQKRCKVGEFHTLFILHNDLKLYVKKFKG